MARYTHTTTIHNLDSPQQIVPVLTSLLPVQSVVDIGCGLGTFLHVFKAHGIKDVLGIDGKWCNKELLFENIEPKDFKEMDLDKPIELDRKFDLAVSLEVGEHLHESRASSFVEDLTKLSDVILFSAAIPFQGGDHHYNEQHLDYWSEKFASSGYELYDILKPLYWNNPKIFWWYKQNMVLFIRSGKANEAIRKLPKNQLKNVIHPELFETFANPNSRHGLKRHIKLSIKALRGQGS